MKARRIRYGVVGAGNIAQVAVLPAFEHARENSELAAIFSSDAEKRTELQKKYGVVTGTYDQFEDLAKAAKLDAVYIATPNSEHCFWTERAAASGLHVLTEKPMAVTEEECDRMIRATAERGLSLMVAYRLHFEKVNLEAMRLIRMGRIGEPRLYSSVFSHQVREGDIRTRGDLGGGALYDLGLYCINAARYVFEAEPLEVFGDRVKHNRRSEEVDEMTSGILRFSRDRIAQFTCSQGAFGVANYRVVGTEGDLLVDPAFEYRDGLELKLKTKNGEETLRVEGRDQFAPELVYFSDCIITKREPEPSGEEGLLDVRVIRALQTSAEEGRVVALGHIRSRKRPPQPDQEMNKPEVRQQETVNAPSPSSGE
jgi:predicted dehydrogenase